MAVKDFNYKPTEDVTEFWNQIHDKNGYLNDMIRRDFVPVYEQAMYKINEYLAVMEAIDKEKLTDKELQLYNAMELCYNVLARTDMIAELKMEVPAEMLEDGEEPTVMCKFPAEKNTLAEEIITQLQK